MHVTGVTDKRLKTDALCFPRAHPRNPCERAGWRSFRGKGPDYMEEQGSSLIVKPVLD